MNILLHHIETSCELIEKYFLKMLFHGDDLITRVNFDPILNPPPQLSHWLATVIS